MYSYLLYVTIVLYARLSWYVAINIQAYGQEDSIEEEEAILQTQRLLSVNFFYFSPNILQPFLRKYFCDKLYIRKGKIFLIPCFRQ